MDHFEQVAENYDQNKERVDNVDSIAQAIVHAVGLKKTMHIMDFGSGTGLLLERIAPYVGKITAVDVSESMNKQLMEKAQRLNCELELLEVDLETAEIDRRFDGIISSMTVHHIKDVPAMFRKFYSMLNSGGFIAIADLDTEDGSFHTHDTGVIHFGFDRDAFARMARDAGFKDIAVSPASVVHKEQGDYSVFLLAAFK